MVQSGWQEQGGRSWPSLRVERSLQQVASSVGGNVPSQTLVIKSRGEGL
jgi:hypothetical protein